jgi:hypothetical protein
MEPGGWWETLSGYPRRCRWGGLGPLSSLLSHGRSERFWVGWAHRPLSRSASHAPWGARRMPSSLPGCRLPGLHPLNLQPSPKSIAYRRLSIIYRPLSRGCEPCPQRALALAAQLSTRIDGSQCPASGP